MSAHHVLGALARAAALTPAQRSAIASKAARVRWNIPVGHAYKPKPRPMKPWSCYVIVNEDGVVWSDPIGRYGAAVAERRNAAESYDGRFRIACVNVREVVQKSKPVKRPKA